jgi:hypothetical protein
MSRVYPVDVAAIGPMPPCRAGRYIQILTEGALEQSEALLFLWSEPNVGTDLNFWSLLLRRRCMFALPVGATSNASIRECEDHGWMQDRADPHAREST